MSASLSGGGYGLSSLWSEPPWLRAATGASLGIGAGIAKEAWDATGRGDASWRDLTWDVVGVATGVGVAWLLDWALRRSHPERGFQMGVAWRTEPGPGHGWRGMVRYKARGHAARNAACRSCFGS